MEKLLFYPVLVAIIGGAVVYIFEALQKRRSLRIAITADISRVLDTANLNREYLERSDHYWLEVNRELTTSPVPFGPRDQAFNALLPELHVLGGKNFGKIVAFYSYYRYCESLRTELFREIQSHQQSRQIVTPGHRTLWDAERQRAAQAYGILCRSYSAEVKLEDLRLRYEFAPATQVERAARQA